MKFSFKELLDDKYGTIIISIILGLGLSAIFRKACKNGKCIVLRGPAPKELGSGNIYSWYDSCIKYEKVPSVCGDEGKIIKQKDE
jgi:hypothetical protein